jgi:hypothetical protein
VLSAPTIATWFVADDSADATYFPQVGARSDAPEAQAVYWRCVVGFFASSLAHNRGVRHAFYTNTRVPVVDGTDLATLFARWGIEVITLPITWRLPRNAVSSWGNQFFVFDVIDHHAASGASGPLVVLDSDCLWIKSAATLLAEVREHGALTYLLGHDEHPADEPINGLTRQGMARFLARNGGQTLPATPYFGGEIYAASAEANARIALRARALWAEVMKQEDDSPREEAHFLSILYALEGIASGTANRFIRRMWTTFHHHNLALSDRELAIWHLPAEKRTGFADLYARLPLDTALQPAQDAAAMGLDQRSIERLMGFPRRGPRKFVRDALMKIREKLKL